MNILLTGGSGMVGQNIIHSNHFKDCNLYSPSREELDLLNKDSINQFLKKNRIDFIIHAAGFVGGIGVNIKYPVEFLYKNLQMGFNLIIEARNSGIKNFLNIGSSCMYPKGFKNPIREEDLLSGFLEPTNEGYAIAKISTAKLCEYISREEKSFLYKTAISCNLFGRFDTFDKETSHLVPAAIIKVYEASQKQNPVNIWGNGKARREFMYAEDLVDFIKYAVENFSKMPQYLNVGRGSDHTVFEYYKLIAEIIDYALKFEFDLSKPEGMERKLLDVSRMESFGWRNISPIPEGLRKTYGFYLDEYT